MENIEIQNKDTIRKENYLNGYNFFSNSVNFRIHSSKAIEKWKNVQAFQLNQLKNGRFYFHKNKREILLLKYDLWSRWIYEIENYCISINEIQDVLTTKSNIDLIIELSNKTQTLFENIICSEMSQYFNNDFDKILVDLNKSSYDFVIQEIQKLENQPLDVLFINIVNLLITTMQYSLFEIYELDFIFQTNIENEENKDVFMIYSDLSEMYYRRNNKFLICERIKVYNKYFDIKEIYLKNYTDVPISLKVLQKIEEMGITIDYQKTLSQK